MAPVIASFIFAAGIAGLLFLDREPEVRLSPALVLPALWLFISSSRSLTEWMAIFQTGHSPLSDQAQAYSEGSPLDRNVIIAIMILAIAVLISRRRLLSLFWLNLPIVGFYVYAAMSVLWSDFPDITIRRLFKALGCCLVTMVAVTDPARTSAARRLLVWLGFILIPSSVLLIKYYPAIGRTYIIASVSDWLLSPTGVTTHKNSLGGICQVYGVVFLWHFVKAWRTRQDPRRTRHLVAHGVALIMVAWLFMQVNSVTAQSSFLLASILIVATNIVPRLRTPAKLHFLAAALLLLPFVMLFTELGEGTLKSMGRDSSLTGRTNIWPRVIALVENPVVGTGFESFWLGSRLEKMQEYQRGLNESHNGLLEIWISMGWIGVTLLLAVIAKAYRNISNLYNLEFDVGVLSVGLFLTVIASSFTEATFRTQSVSWFILLMIAVTPSRRALELGVAATTSVGRRKAVLV